MPVLREQVSVLHVGAVGDLELDLGREPRQRRLVLEADTRGRDAEVERVRVLGLRTERVLVVDLALVTPELREHVDAALDRELTGRAELPLVLLLLFLLLLVARVVDRGDDVGLDGRRRRRRRGCLRNRRAWRRGRRDRLRRRRWSRSRYCLRRSGALRVQRSAIRENRHENELRSGPKPHHLPRPG